MAAKITVRGLHHEYVNRFTRERVVALAGVDLEVAEGEVAHRRRAERVRQEHAPLASWPA